MRQKVTFRPGIVRDSTNYSNEGGWYDADKIRFTGGDPETIGGWQKLSQLSFLGSCRSLHDWVALDSSIFLGTGTHLKYYIEYGGIYYDITPIRRTVTLAANGLQSFGIGSGRVKVNDPGHGAVVGSYVTISGATAFAGLTTGNLNKEHTVAVVIDANNYYIDTGGTAVTAGTNGGGAAIVCTYQLNIGTDTSVYSSGWGAGFWGRGAWGSAAASVERMRIWTHDNFGQDLLINPSGGGIYIWDRTSGLSTRATDLSTASGASGVPVACTQVLVSANDRHVIAYGANPIGSSVADPMLVRWSDAEDATNWTPDTTNTAGDQRLSSGTGIIGAFKTRQGKLVFTDQSVYSQQFVGERFVFGFEMIAEGVSIVGINAGVSAADSVFWMDINNFYQYNGSVQSLPCPVRSYVFDDINLQQGLKIFAAANSRFNEVWWFYPSFLSQEVDRYIVYNYLNGWWSIGSLRRTAWLDSRSQGYPIGAADGYLYFHEIGFDADGDSLAAFVESSDFDIGDGDRVMLMTEVMPDIYFKPRVSVSQGWGSGVWGRGTWGSSAIAPDTGQSVQVVVRGRNFPGESLSTYPANTFYSGGYTFASIRVRKRQAALRVQSNSVGTGWRAGNFRFDMQQDGDR